MKTFQKRDCSDDLDMVKCCHPSGDNRDCRDVVALTAFEEVTPASLAVREWVPASLENETDRQPIGNKKTRPLRGGLVRVVRT